MLHNDQLPGLVLMVDNDAVVRDLRAGAVYAICKAGGLDIWIDMGTNRTIEK